MCNWFGNDLPETNLIFLVEYLQELGVTTPLQHDQPQWRLFQQTLALPEATGFIEVHLRGARRPGTDNDAYVDGLDVRFIP